MRKTDGKEAKNKNMKNMNKHAGEKEQSNSDDYYNRENCNEEIEESSSKKFIHLEERPKKKMKQNSKETVGDEYKSKTNSEGSLAIEESSNGTMEQAQTASAEKKKKKEQEVVSFVRSENTSVEKGISGSSIKRIKEKEKEKGNDERNQAVKYAEEEEVADTGVPNKEDGGGAAENEENAHSDVQKAEVQEEKLEKVTSNAKKSGRGVKKVSSKAKVNEKEINSADNKNVAKKASTKKNN